MFYWNLFFYPATNCFDFSSNDSFNPCFIGTYSFTLHHYLLLFLLFLLSFNPCFIGTYSFTYKIDGLTRKFEMRFNPCFIGTYSFTEYLTRSKFSGMSF